MSFKTKVLGLTAAAALSMSIVSGVAAEDTTATFNENPDGECTAAATSSTVDFGTYTWDGTKYVANTDPVVNFNVSQTYAPGVTCKVNVSSSDLTSGEGNTISKDHLLLINGSGQNAVSPIYIAYGLTIVNGGVGAYAYDVHLNNLWDPNLEPGTYTGTLTFTASKFVP